MAPTYSLVTWSHWVLSSSSTSEAELEACRADGVVKLQKAALLWRTELPPPFLPSLLGIAIPIASGSSWCAGLDQTGTGSCRDKWHRSPVTETWVSILLRAGKTCLSPYAVLCQLMILGWEWGIKKQSVGGKQHVKVQSFFGQSGSYKNRKINYWRLLCRQMFHLLFVQLSHWFASVVLVFVFVFIFLN